MYTIDIDVGGTFTDGFFTDGHAARTAKVLTTPHDVTECIAACVAAGASAFETDLRGFLRRTDVARVSTTIGTNLLVQSKGAKLGLLVTKGHEADLYGEGPALLVGQYVAPDMIEGLAEKVAPGGELVKPLDEEETLAAIRRLIDKGARMIVVSFANAWANAANERAVRNVLNDRYPVHYLRTVPLQIGSEVVHVADDHARTNSVLLNAYIHADMARALYRAEDRLRAEGLSRPLLVAHASGGTARVAKTVAIHTLHSGPAAAAMGAAAMAGLLGLDRVLTGDMGGTSFDMAVVVNGCVDLEDRPMLGGIRMAVPMIEIETLGAGGGSIARVEDGGIRVGPDSAGAAPGPVSYDKGGLEPTVTDANLLLGFIDPGFFLGGRMRLDADKARRAVERRIGRATGLSAEEAARRIRAAINATMAREMEKRLRDKRHDPAQFALFAIGGAGALHACDIAEAVGIASIVCFPFGSVFSAYGSSVSDVRHAYERTLPPGPNDRAQLIEIAQSLLAQAETDMAGEGFAAEQASIRLRLSSGAETAEQPVACGEVALALDRLLPAGATTVAERIAILASAPVPHWAPPRAVPGPADPEPARKSARPVDWGDGAPVETPVYDRERLTPGHRIAGPAIVEGADTIYPVGRGWQLLVDPHGLYLITRTEA